MKLSYNRQIIHHPFNNDGDNKSEEKIVDNQTGGSSTEFSSDSDQSEELSNNFNVKNFQTIRKTVNNGNSLEIDLIQLLGIDGYKSLVFLDVFCIESSDQQLRKIPIRFLVHLEDNNGTRLTLGTMSNFTMSNLSDNLISLVRISEMKLPADKTATLVISLGTSAKYGALS